MILVMMISHRLIKQIKFWQMRYEYIYNDVIILSFRPKIVFVPSVFWLRLWCCRFQDNLQLPACTAPPRTRVIRCLLCQTLGHYQKTCPRRQEAVAVADDGAAALPTATTQTVKKRSRVLKSTKSYSSVTWTSNKRKWWKCWRIWPRGSSCGLHHNVHGLPIDAADAFADAVAGDDETEVVDTDSGFKAQHWTNTAGMSEQEKAAKKRESNY